MSVRLRLAAAAAVALTAVVAAACSSGHHGRSIAVTVVDAHGLPVAGATVVSSLGETILGSATTGADGKATVAMRTGAEVTAHEHDGGGRFVSVTIAGAAPGSAITLPLVTTFAGGGNAVPSTIDVSGPPGVTFATIAAGDQCQNTESIGTPNNLSVEPWCVQRDGAISVFAVGFDTNLVAVAWGATLDQGLGTGVPVAVDGSAGAAVTVSAAGVDTSALFSFGVSVEPMRKGQAIGPTLSADATLSASGALHGFASATSVIATLALDGPVGAQTVVHASAPASSYTFSASELLPAAGGLAVDTAFTGGRAGGAWDAPASTPATIVEVQIHWDDDLSNPHDWFLFEPASLATGRAIVRMPPLPAALADFLAKPGNLADQFHVTYLSADFVTDPTHLDQLVALPPDSFTMSTVEVDQPL